MPGSRTFRTLVAFGVLSAAPACSDSPATLAYENRRPFSPPMETYGRWWTQLQACSDRTGDLDGLQWFLADYIGATTGPPTQSAKGQWTSNREITLLSGHERELGVVKHEMLHDLLRGDGQHRHPAWDVCVTVDRMPGDPAIPTGTYDYELVRTEGTTEWRFHGTLTITTVDEAMEVQGTWDVTSAGGDSRYADTITSGHWDLDAYVIGATVVGDPGWEIQNRIAGVDGEVKCRIARIGAEAAACILHGPR